MPTLVDPIHTAPICGTLVRFFAAPIGRTEVPWHASADLAVALGLPVDLRCDLLAGFWSECDDGFAKVETPAGPLLLQSGATTHLLSVPARFFGFAPEGFVADFEAACDAAVALLGAGLGDAERTNLAINVAVDVWRVRLVLTGALPVSLTLPRASAPGAAA